MTIGESISSIRELLNRGQPSDDNRYPESFIYHNMKNVRARLIKSKKDKYQELSPFTYQTLECFPLDWTTLYDCPCFTVDCKYLVSRYDLPTILSYRNGLLIDSVRTLAGKKIDRLDLTEVEYNKYSKTKKNSLGWFIHNNKLVIVGNSKLKVITVRAIFDDPLALSEIPVCDGDGVESGDSCFNPRTSDFPIEQEMINDLETMVVEKIMKYGERNQQDNENNAKAKEVNGKE